MPGSAPRLSHTPNTAAAAAAAAAAEFQPPYFPPPYMPGHPGQQAVDFSAHDPYHTLHHQQQHYQQNMLRQREEQVRFNVCPSVRPPVSSRAAQKSPP